MKNRLCKLILIMAVAFIVNGLAFAQARPQVGKYAKVYKGSEGLYLTIVRLGPSENMEALLLIEGIDHPWDGKIMVAKTKKASKKTEYAIKVDGKSYVVFIKRSGSGELYLERNGDPDYVTYNEGRSRQVVPEHFLTRYLEQ